MKALLIPALALAAATGFAQSQGSSASLSSASGRLSVVKNSIEIPVWHEKDFWPLYERYVDADAELASATHRALHALAFLGHNSTAIEAGEAARNYFSSRFTELELRKKYYKLIEEEFNGVIGFQFLQAETVMDMMEHFGIFHGSPWNEFRFQASAIPAEHAFQAKLNMLKAAVSLSEGTSEPFVSIYTAYENECDNLLDGYEIFSLYSGEAKDFTPALAKRLGYDFILITERELRLKEKYFYEMEKAVGAELAAEFLAWEDYNSIVRKMQVWAEP